MKSLLKSILSLQFNDTILNLPLFIYLYKPIIYKTWQY